MFRVTYTDDSKREPEDVDATHYKDNGEWIDFTKSHGGGGTTQVLRIRSAIVERVERV